MLPSPGEPVIPAGAPVGDPMSKLVSPKVKSRASDRKSKVFCFIVNDFGGLGGAIVPYKPNNQEIVYLVI